MLTRRRFLRSSAMASAMLASGSLLRSGFAQMPNRSGRALRLAILGSVFTARFGAADDRGPLHGRLPV